MSFVDLMKNDIWSNLDIDKKIQNLIRSRFTQEDELKAARLSRLSDSSAEDLSFINAVDSWVQECISEGRQARKDNELLKQVIDFESAKNRLKQPVVELEYSEDGQVLNQSEYDKDNEERNTATTVVDSATEEVVSLYLIRNPESDSREETNGTY